MVKQGDIILLNFNPQAGYEQAGYRPALVISNNVFNKRTGLAILCPITSKEKKYPLRVELDNNTKTHGFILCEHIKSLDIEARGYKVVEQVSKEILQEVINIVFAEIEMG